MDTIIMYELKNLENEGNESFLAEWQMRQNEYEKMRKFWEFWR